MAHKYVLQEDVDRLRREVALCDASIRRVKEMAAGTPEGLKAALEMIKDLRDHAMNKKNEGLDVCSPNSPASIHYWRGEEVMAATIISMFDDPKQAVEAYEDQKVKIQKDIELLQKQEIREDSGTER